MESLKRKVIRECSEIQKKRLYLNKKICGCFNLLKPFRRGTPIILADMDIEVGQVGYAIKFYREFFFIEGMKKYGEKIAPEVRGSIRDEFRCLVELAKKLRPTGYFNPLLDATIPISDKMLEKMNEEIERANLSLEHNEKILREMEHVVVARMIARKLVLEGKKWEF